MTRGSGVSSSLKVPSAGFSEHVRADLRHELAAARRCQAADCGHRRDGQEADVDDAPRRHRAGGVQRLAAVPLLQRPEGR